MTRSEGLPVVAAPSENALPKIASNVKFHSNGHLASLQDAHSYQEHYQEISRASDEASRSKWKIVQREQVANPTPLGLFAFGYTTAHLQGFKTGLTEPGTNNIVYAYAFFFGGLVQLIVGMWEFKRNKTFGAASFGTYGGFWLGYALFEILSQVIPGYEIPPKGEMMFLSLWGILTLVFSFGTLCFNFAMWLLFILNSILFFILAGAVGPDLVNRAAAGWLGFFVAGIAWYIATADIINEMYHMTVLPLGRWNVGVPLFDALKSLVGKVPLIGWVYVRSCDREDRLAGYVKDIEQADGQRHNKRVEAGSLARGLNDSAMHLHKYQIHGTKNIPPGSFEGKAVRRQGRDNELGSGSASYREGADGQFRVRV